NWCGRRDRRLLPALGGQPGRLALAPGSGSAGVIAILASAAIDPGVHITRKLFGLSINVDTVWASAIAGALILLLGFAIRAKATAGVPGKLQLAFETIVTGVSR